MAAPAVVAGRPATWPKDFPLNLLERVHDLEVSGSAAARRRAFFELHSRHTWCTPWCTMLSPIGVAPLCGICHELKARSPLGASAAVCV